MTTYALAMLYCSAGFLPEIFMSATEEGRAEVGRSHWQRPLEGMTTIFFLAYKRGVPDITPGQKVIWNYDPPAGHEVGTSIPIAKQRVLYIQSGDAALLRVVNIMTKP